MSQALQLCSLPSASCQPRRTHFQGMDILLMKTQSSLRARFFVCCVQRFPLLFAVHSRFKGAREKHTSSTKCEFSSFASIALVECSCFNIYDRVNIGCGRAEERILLTGLHAVADIYCNSCKTTLGWKYVSLSFTEKNSIMCFMWLCVTVGTCVWGKSKVQGGKIYHRTGTHG